MVSATGCTISSSHYYKKSCIIYHDILQDATDWILPERTLRASRYAARLLPFFILNVPPPFPFRQRKTGNSGRMYLKKITISADRAKLVYIQHSSTYVRAIESQETRGITSSSHFVSVINSKKRVVQPEASNLLRYHQIFHVRLNVLSALIQKIRSCVKKQTRTIPTTTDRKLGDCYSLEDPRS